MSLIEIILIAFSLSLDCFAVSISSGGTMKYLNIKDMFKMAFFFGFFQAIMPLIGFFAGIGVINYIQRIDHWIAFVLLFVVGAKMIYESYKLEDADCSKNNKCPFGIETLLILSIATSIDALAIGVTFSITKTPILTPVIIIGAVSFVMSIAGIDMGYRGRSFFENKMEKIAGLILIALGLKILISHLI
jgi:putative Mn2+ efflux pump MntP